MRSRRAITFLPALALAPISFLVSCSSDGNDAVGSTVAVSSQPGGATDTGGSTDSSATSGSEATSGPTLTEVVQATLANGSARYLMAADTESPIDDLVAALLQGAEGSGSEGTTDTSTGSSDTTVAATDSGATTTMATETTTGDSSGSSVEATGGCELPKADRLSGAAQADATLHCVVLPDGTQLVVEDRDIDLGADGAWTVTSVQFDQALAQLETEQLVALHDPLAVLRALGGESVGGTGSDGSSSDTSGSATTDTVSQGSTETSSGGSVANSSGETMPESTDTGSSSGSTGSGIGHVQGTMGPNGLEYQVNLPLTDVDDPFLVAVAQRAGAQSITVHVYADDAGTEVRAMAYEFQQAATTTGGATGNGTGGTTVSPGSETTNGSPQNPAGGGNGSTTSAVGSLPDSGSTTVPSTTFEDIPNVAVALFSDTSSVTIAVPSEADALNLGDLGASFTVDLGNGQG